MKNDIDWAGLREVGYPQIQPAARYLYREDVQELCLPDSESYKRGYDENDR